MPIKECAQNGLPVCAVEIWTFFIKIGTICQNYGPFFDVHTTELLLEPDQLLIIGP